jgi:hypothetical protein
MSEDSVIKVRCLVQQCLNAKLQTRIADEANKISAEHVEVIKISLKTN